MKKKSTCLLLVCLWGTQLYAQTEEPATTLEEVLVTAQTREQNIQDVPIALDAVSRDAIIAQRI